MTGGTLLSEEGYLHILSIILDRLQRPDEVVISGYQYGRIVIIFKSMRQHIGCQLHIHPFS